MSLELKTNPIEENRIIYLGGDFNEEKAKEVVKKLLTFEAKDPTKDILMYIDSYGGYVHSFLAIHDIMKMMRCDVATVGLGKSMSCGQLLLMSGTKGKRFITPNTRVLVHEVSSFTHGKLANMEIDIKESKELQKIIEKLIVRYTNITVKKLKGVMDIDSYFSANQTVELGIADYVITSPSVLYKKIKI
ncbi:MAG TPA: ATP-dependent Clp protease proteolytic subunit [Candidatus Glassbacteria bacterium]|nr:ATP-dependent Clp protease proteolytic subunit [Candidatus Glassbacteria bacterium]